MVHNFIPINIVIIKDSYPMRRYEPILHTLYQAFIKVMFQIDGSNSYQAVPLFPPNTYKTTFSSYIGQLYYLRIGQGLTGALGTFLKLKDIIIGPVPPPFAETMLLEVELDIVFVYFLADDFRGAANFNNLLYFLHNHYFPRIIQAQLTLNPAKYRLFTANINLLSFLKTSNRLRPSANKIAAIRDYPIPKNDIDLLKFCYILPFLRSLIPARADLDRQIKKAILQRVNIYIDD